MWKGAVKLSNDECYPASFNCDSEIFYPKFYKIFIDNPKVFKCLSHECSMLLVKEIGNLVLGHISGATFVYNVLTFSYDQINLPTRKNPPLHT